MCVVAFRLHHKWHHNHHQRQWHHQRSVSWQLADGDKKKATHSTRICRKINFFPCKRVNVEKYSERNDECTPLSKMSRVHHCNFIPGIRLSLCGYSCFVYYELAVLACVGHSHNESVNPKMFRNSMVYKYIVRMFLIASTQFHSVRMASTYHYHHCLKLPFFFFGRRHRHFSMPKSD